MTPDNGKDESCSQLPPVAPEWPRLADLPGWVARRYGVSAHIAAPDLILAVRRGSLRHRVPPIKADHSSMRRPSLPPGLAEESPHGVRRVFVSSWVLAEASWADGTVGGCERDGARQRLAIEVDWRSVEDFVSGVTVRVWKQKDAEKPAIPAAAPGVPASPDEHKRAVAEWMRRHADASLAASGALVKRDAAVRLCMTQNRCTYRQALAAWRDLPGELRRKPRQTDRAMTGR